MKVIIEQTGAVIFNKCIWIFMVKWWLWEGIDMKKNIIISFGIFLALWIILELFKINSAYVMPNMIEWATKFILPWLFLYWLIRLTKNIERKR